ncbi:hypothetical protein PLESTB_000874700 [Pleodorina starrii]|uniref:Uncharacterized protein n=1 Tax=Pleodorina starrii TaxID=330485 RepID=A0A9W6BM28_9CHLO|nr:hypothetical protein PLESTM_001752900 [Pleodorina starrii]GLC54513.1 hypothetical protein PLESTB_000874700 [Pleodorina starrii]GLC76109.1 hypothetical protein PLESTF_001735900 [Pleodorina starrii]
MELAEKPSMQKPLAYANDLADHDIIEDDGELVFGPHSAKLSAFNPGPGRQQQQQQQQLGSSNSSKALQHQDTSILGSAPLVAKLAQSLAVPTQPAIMPRCFLVPEGHVYAGGNPIISMAPTSRPGSAATAAQVRQPCTRGETSTAHGGKAVAGGEAATSAAAAAAAARQDGGAELQGDIQSGGRDRDSSNSSARPRSGLLRRLSSLTSGTLRSASRPPSAKPESAAEAATTPGVASGAARGPDGQLRRASLEPCVSTRSAAIPCVDVAGERRQLPRQTSLLDAPLAATTSQAGSTAPAPKDAAGSAGQQPQPQAAEAPTCMGPPSTPGASAARTAASAAPPERPSTPLRRLSRLLSGSLIAPAAAAVAAAATTAAVSDQRDQDGAGASKGGRVSSAGVGMRDLFSRPSSARGKSDAGSGGGRAGSQTQVPMEAWKHQQRHGPEVSEDGPADDCVKDFGPGAVVVRQPSGVFKRAANALASALTR